ncbi:uncharacterized protein TNIN_462491 [Trichonephila inaurata madagascariensis]|uniref:Secreted protein n=1 Tax=Trichonephila inaurata madagascariensis TaxID=2747483 RepID=A0A8X6M9A3_9ARAC|nr:uncharacterized protein TNIN_462491 [Trichonephila inaurata madagascariensis]
MKMSLPALFLIIKIRGITLGIIKTKSGVNKKLVSLSDHPGIKSTNAIGRVYTVHHNNTECFHEEQGPTSFQYLKTVEGRICSNYKAACLVTGLLENDEH